MQLSGLNKLQAMLKRLALKAKNAEASAQVGFTQKYAVFVHENKDAAHLTGQAKFLEIPAKTLQPELRRIIREVYKQTGSMREALLVAGYRLQREAQLLTPVDTSALKASAYTAVDSEANAIADAAFQKSEQIRLSVLASRKGKK